MGERRVGDELDMEVDGKQTRRGVVEGGDDVTLWGREGWVMS